VGAAEFAVCVMAPPVSGDGPVVKEKTTFGRVVRALKKRSGASVFFIFVV